MLSLFSLRERGWTKVFSFLSICLTGMQLLNMGGSRHFKTYVMLSPFLMHSSAPWCLHNRSEETTYMKEHYQLYLFITFLYFKCPFIYCMTFCTFRLWQQWSVNAYKIRLGISRPGVLGVWRPFMSNEKHLWIIGAPQEWAGIRRCPGPFFIVA